MAAHGGRVAAANRTDQGFRKTERLQVGDDSLHQRNDCRESLVAVEAHRLQDAGCATAERDQQVRAEHRSRVVKGPTFIGNPAWNAAQLLSKRFELFIELRTRCVNSDERATECFWRPLDREGLERVKGAYRVAGHAGWLEDVESHRTTEGNDRGPSINIGTAGDVACHLTDRRVENRQEKVSGGIGFRCQLSGPGTAADQIYSMARRLKSRRQRATEPAAAEDRKDQERAPKRRRIPSLLSAAAGTEADRTLRRRSSRPP